MIAKYANKEHTVISLEVNESEHVSFLVDPGNRDYQIILEENIPIEPFPIPSPESVRFSKLAQLETDKQKFIRSYPDGSQRYDDERRSAFLSIYNRCLAALISPLATPEQKDLAGQKMELIQEVWDWVEGSVMLHFYQKWEEIALSPDPESVTWDFSFLEATDPHLMVSDLWAPPA